MRKCDFSKVDSNFVEITLSHGCSPVNLLHICRTAVDEHLWALFLQIFFRYKSCPFFHTSNSIAYHTWILPQIFEFNLNSIS